WYLQRSQHAGPADPADEHHRPVPHALSAYCQLRSAEGVPPIKNPASLGFMGVEYLGCTTRFGRIPANAALAKHPCTFLDVRHLSDQKQLDRIAVWTSSDAISARATRG